MRRATASTARWRRCVAVVVVLDAALAYHAPRARLVRRGLAASSSSGFDGQQPVPPTTPGPTATEAAASDAAPQRRPAAERPSSPEDRRRPGIISASPTAEDADSAAPAACIQFVRGIDERVAPTVSVTRSANYGRAAKAQDVFFTGTATFWFDKASSLHAYLGHDRLITGMHLVDEEGVMSTTDVHARFDRGRPIGISSVLVLSNPTEWHRFLRFMKRYSERHGLTFTSAADDRSSGAGSGSGSGVDGRSATPPGSPSSSAASSSSSSSS